MASLSRNRDGTCTIQFVTIVDGARKRRSIRLGKCDPDLAAKTKTKVARLSAWKLSGQPLDNQTAKWVRQLDTGLYDKLAAVGLLRPRLLPELVTLGQFVEDYIDRRFDVKWSTRVLFGNVRRNLVDFFGRGRLLNSITASHADEWRRWLAQPVDEKDPQAGGQGLAPETVRQRCRIAKQFFRDAVRRELLSESPLDDMKGVSAKGNREKDFFVTVEMAAKVLQACPDSQWRLIFALTRFAGLRCPSEVLLLRWGDVDFEQGRFVVHSPKTEHHEGKATHVVPIFPELLSHFQAIYRELLEDFDPKQLRLSEQPVITKWRESEVNLRTALHRIIRAAGLDPWPKAFVALRSTCRTELEELFPSHVINAWLGHSQRIAEQHYLQVTPEHIETATCTKRGARIGSSEDFSAAPNHKDSQTPGNLRVFTKQYGQGGHDRTRICDLLHVKQAL